MRRHNKTQMHELPWRCNVRGPRTGGRAGKGNKASRDEAELPIESEQECLLRCPLNI
jgi:hypothetical protein